MVRRYFGTDGIRGRANSVITPELALRVGMAAGTAFQRGEHRHRVVIGKDTRLSGYMIETALVAGFTSVGMDVLLLGPMPTPAVAMLTRSMRADLGVMISASHNPYDDNGIKLFGPDGYKLSDEVEREIEELIDGDLSRKRLADSADLGRAKRIDGVQDRYIEFAKRTLPRNMSARWPARRGRLRQRRGLQAWRPRRCGSSARKSSPSASIRTASTSTRTCGSTAPEALAEKVREMRADIGIALDGDADRVVIVDETRAPGRRRPADGRDRGKLEGRRPAREARHRRHHDVESRPRALSRAASGSTLVRTPVGDRYVLEHMREHGYNLGGEQSGHIILSDYATTGDGFVAALQVLAVVKKDGRPVSEVCHRFEPLPQVLKNVRYTNGKPLEHAEVRSAIADAEQRLGRKGRLIVRPSGHRAGDPRDGRRRRQDPGRGSGRRHRRRP